MATQTTAASILETSRSQPDHAAWYVIHTKPLKEGQAAMALQEQLGLTVYVPEVRRPFQGTTRSAPFFPRYLFAHADLSQVCLSAINHTPGVLRLVCFDDQPQPIPATVMRELHQRIEQLNAQGYVPQYAFQSGDPVRLRSGPLRGLEAVFVAPLGAGERVRILLDFLGRLNETNVDAVLLEPASAPAPQQQHPPRRTRGKGRVIHHSG